METWRSVKGYEGKYEVSDLGRVRSVDRVENFRNSKRRRKGRIMKSRFFGKYESVHLSDYDKSKTTFIHRLVAEAFIGDVTGKVVDHIDFDPSNNKASNLQILTQRENIHRSVNADRHNYGEKHGMSKLSSDAVKILRSAKRGEISNICKSLNITYSTAKRIRRGESWKHVI